MTNMLDLVPAFQRQIGGYVNAEDTESKLAAYLADAIQALMFRWERDYTITFTAPQTYVASPNVAEKDIRPIVLMASIIYKMANTAMASFIDGDFSYNPHKGPASSLEIDRNELLSYLGAVRLAKPVAGPMRGYAYAFNSESYSLFLAGGWIAGGNPFNI